MADDKLSNELPDALIDAHLGLAYKSSGLNAMAGESWDRVVARRFFALGMATAAGIIDMPAPSVAASPVAAPLVRLGEHNGGDYDMRHQVHVAAPQPTQQPTERALLEQALEALADMLGVIDAAGLLNLSNGVQLGPTVWYVKASDATDYARATIVKLRAHLQGEQP